MEEYDLVFGCLGVWDLSWKEYMYIEQGIALLFDCGAKYHAHSSDLQLDVSRVFISTQPWCSVSRILARNPCTSLVCLG